MSTQIASETTFCLPTHEWTERRSNNILHTSFTDVIKLYQQIHVVNLHEVIKQGFENLINQDKTWDKINQSSPVDT
jgi:hypothetical protein